ncbi:MAG: GTPase HflX [Flavobacteriales bacterium]|jgi:GTP-binding protein HflX|nr:GTPase HflX [Flavobacteriales bacterium]
MLEKPLARKDGKPERAVLVGLATRDQPRDLLAEYLDELEFLARTANAETIHTFTQSLDHPDVRTFVGKGKFQEITEYIEEHDIDLLIFDDELSPSQLRNLGEALPETKVLDRANLILDIFAQRARTAHAKTQVELAQYQYLLPRLTNMWTHLQKQKGGIGMKGPGEKEIETDRRIIRDRISALKKDLAAIDRQMATQRGNRGALVRVALVGYTNAGKSTLMNRLAKSEVFAEDKLFATLDTTVRKVVVHNLPFLLSDTVGFIRKLPHQLVESFKSTLDETRESDLLVHVIDVSHPQFEDHLRVVEETLAEIGAGAQRTMLIFNKIDQLQDPDGEVDRDLLIEGLRRRFADHDGPVLFLSAKTKEGMDSLREVLYAEVRELHVQRFPHNHFLY